MKAENGIKRLLCSAGFLPETGRSARIYIKTSVSGILLFLVLLLCHASAVDAKTYHNPETGYRAYVEDDADLLKDSEELALLAKMKQVTSYGGAAFVSSQAEAESAGKLAESRYREFFGKDSGTLFLIDMYNRKIWIFSDGAIYKIITKGYANTITDNVFRKATYGHYYECAAEAFDQINLLLDGQAIAQPMKHISNALVAFVLALLLCYGFVKLTGLSLRPTAEAILGAAVTSYALRNSKTSFVGETKKYDPVSHGSGGGSGGGGFFGGGGSSGGGGGHSF